MKKLLIIILPLFALIGCEKPEVDYSFTLDQTTLQMKVSDMITLNAEGNVQNLEWTSSDDSVATVFHGVVTAKAIGASTITVTNGKHTCTCIVYVSGSDGSTLRISPAYVELKKGETFQMSCGNTYDLPLTWSSSNTEVATVIESGLVTAHAAGNAYIMLTTGIDTVSALVTIAHNWGEYQLVWSDEFEGTELDQSVWTIQKGTGNGGWGNNEKQYYTDRSENLRVENGNLIIQARKEDYNGSEYTSARLMTKDKKTFTYGKMEARISLPSGGGLWPAFWMMGNSGGWPACGEIDIMEYVGNVPNRILGTLHTTKDRSGSKSSKAYWGTNIENNFHVYGIEWTQEEQNGKDIIRFYVDDDVFSTQVESVIDDKDYWPFNKPHFFILNLAVGGNLGGSIDNAIWSTDRIMYVDWVRVYQREDLD